jgi:hypothetical protein
MDKIWIGDSWGVTQSIKQWNELTRFRVAIYNIQSTFTAQLNASENEIYGITDSLLLAEITIGMWNIVTSFYMKKTSLNFKMFKAIRPV